MNRRRVLGGIGAVVAGSISGCAAIKTTLGMSDDGDKPAYWNWFGPEMAVAVNFVRTHGGEMEYIDRFVKLSPSKVVSEDSLDINRLEPVETLKFGSGEYVVDPEAIETRVFEANASFQLLRATSADATMCEGFRDQLESVSDKLEEHEGFELGWAEKLEPANNMGDHVRQYDSFAVDEETIIVLRNSMSPEQSLDRIRAVVDTFVGEESRYVDESADSETVLELLGDGFYLDAWNVGLDRTGGLRMRLDGEQVQRRVVVGHESESEAEEKAKRYREEIERYSGEQDNSIGVRLHPKFHLYTEKEVRTEGSRTIFDGRFPVEELASEEFEIVY